jgi:hypothetical protein
MKTAYSMMASMLAGVAVLYGAAAAQSDRAFENVSVLAKGRSATLRLKAGESERVLEP